MKYNLFTNQFENADLNKDKIAFIGSDAEITWGDFKTATEELTLKINTLNLPKGYPIFIYGHKQTLFTVAILACLQLEHPFIPLDEIYPEKRIAEILKETNSNVIIDCTSKLKIENTISITKEEGIFQINNLSTSISESTVQVYQNERLGYIIFTSGSTGKPKGVLIRKSSILTLIDWIASDSFKMSSADVFVNQSPFSFDVSLFDTFANLHYGATMLMVSRELAKSPPNFRDQLLKYKATFWTSTPSFIFLYQREGWFNSQQIPSLKKFLFAGELLSPKIVSNLYAHFKIDHIWNAFGPTEATVITTLFDCTEEAVAEYPILPIGYSKPNSKMLTIPEDANADHLGELVIQGDNVADGYLNRSEQTADRFYTINNQKAYKTGDLGYIKNGLIFCLGRNDDQIKFNGYRLELEEINKKILEINAVADVKTIGLKRNNKVVKIVTIYQAQTAINKSEFVAYLENKLPHYMIPSDFLKVASFPLNTSGKTDRSKLQEFYLTEKKKK